MELIPGAPRSLVVAAPAKLNLFLHVTGRRADGYHTLETLFVPISLADTILLRLRDDGAIVRIRSSIDIDPERDLALRAAKLLREYSGTRAGVELAIDKRIPVGGGLGGGSSDAASVMLALNRLWGLGLNRERLRELALQLGADVPFFVFGEPALARGIGEALSSVSLPPTWFAILAPPIEVSTALVFSDLQLTPRADSAKISVFSDGYGRNDLQAVATARFPEIAEHVDMLVREGQARDQARMTGSGACVFAAFDREEAALEALEHVPHGTLGFVARALNVHPLRNFATP